MRDTFHYWLPFLTKDVPAELTSPVDVARFELDQALPVVAPNLKVELCPTGDGEAFTLKREGDTVTITLSKGKELKPVTMPVLTGMQIDKAGSYPVAIGVNDLGALRQLWGLRLNTITNNK